MKLMEKILDLRGAHKEAKEATKLHWNEMMSYASMKALLAHRIEILLFIENLGSSGNVKKHTKRLQAFMTKLNELENIELNSKTYIKQVLTPLKKEREEFEAFKKGSVTNVLSTAQITLIETTAERMAETQLAA
jgi:hypothetical protein